MNKQALITLLGLSLVSASAVAELTEEVSYSFPIDDDGYFSLDNVNGDVTVVGGSGDTVEVLAIKKAGSQKAMDRIEILVDHGDDFVRVETKLHSNNKSWFNWGNGNSGSVEYRVEVPGTISLDGLDSVNGDIEVEGVSGVVKADTVNGDIEVSGIASDVNFDTVNGAIEARFDRLEGSQKARMETVNGTIEVYLPDDADTSVTADTVNGSIRGGDFGLEVEKGRFVGQDMRGSIGSGSARLSMDTVNGAIRVKRD